jgi:hypothetical protein
VGNSTVPNRVSQSPGKVLLTEHLGETARPVPAVQGLIGRGFAGVVIISHSGSAYDRAESASGPVVGTFNSQVRPSQKPA